MALSGHQAHASNSPSPAWLAEVQGVLHPQIASLPEGWISPLNWLATSTCKTSSFTLLLVHTAASKLQPLITRANRGIGDKIPFSSSKIIQCCRVPEWSFLHTWFWNIDACTTSCFTDGMELWCSFSCSEGTRRHCPSKNLSKVRAGEEKVSFPAIRVPPGCSGTEKLDYWRSASLLSTTFTRLSKTPCHCRYFSHDVPQKKATPVQRAGTYSSSKRKNRYSPFHNSLRRLLNLPVLQLHMRAEWGVVWLKCKQLKCSPWFLLGQWIERSEEKDFILSSFENGPFHNNRLQNQYPFPQNDYCDTISPQSEKPWPS